MKTLINKLSNSQSWLGYFFPIADIVARLYIARVFFLSGLSKIQDWETTMYLFEEEYKVPLLSPTLAAIGGTAGELILPVLLAIGLFTPLSAFGLFLLNIVAFVSYYEVLIDLQAAWTDHLQWGIILALLMASKSGALSVDRLINRS
jgi:putative oxidoreductase